MTAHVNTVAFQGVDVVHVDVQVQMGAGLPAFTIVGLPDKAVGESRERVRAALQALGLSLPARRITVNLAPADLAKEGSHYDLPIALGLLAAVNGVLPAAIDASARNQGLICPAAQGAEAAWAGDIDILAAPDVLALVNHLKGAQLLRRPVAGIMETRTQHPDLRDIKAQESAKRALEISATERLWRQKTRCGPGDVRPRDETIARTPWPQARHGAKLRRQQRGPP